MEQMGRIPKQGDLFIYKNLCITVVKLDDRRIESAQIRYWNRKPQRKTDSLQILSPLRFLMSEEVVLFM